MIDYVITSHGHLEGVRLSKRGHWANVPFETEENAEDHAKNDAAGEPFTLTRKHFRALPEFNGERGAAMDSPPLD